MQSNSKDYTKKKYDQVLPGGINEWPVVALSRNRAEFIKEVTEESIRRIKANNKSREALIEEIETTLFREKLRIKRNPWAVDPPDEAAFLNSIKERLLDIAQTEDDKAKDEQLDAILYDIIGRYSNEIAGNFKKSRYRMGSDVI